MERWKILHSAKDLDVNIAMSYMLHTSIQHIRHCNIHSLQL